MSDWCPDHPTYNAIRTPRAICGRCWQLYFYRHPESDLKPAVESLVTLGENFLSVDTSKTALEESLVDTTKGGNHAKR